MRLNCGTLPLRQFVLIQATHPLAAAVVLGYSPQRWYSGTHRSGAGIMQGVSLSVINDREDGVRESETAG